MSDLLSEIELSTHQQAEVKEISSKMNWKNIQSITEFGKDTQVKLLHFSNKLAEEIHNSDTMNVDQILSQLLVKVSQFDVDDVLGRRGIFAKILPPKRPSQKLISKYQRMSVEVDYISTRLEKEGKLLEKEIDILDKMYEMNKEYYASISMYITAGKYKINELKTIEIPSLQQKLSNANPIEKETFNDLERYINLLDKRIYDLQLSQHISIQKAPQIKMIQENHRILLEKIQSSILNTIPLWKDQFILGLTLERQSQALSMQRKITNATNEILEKNSELVRSSSLNVENEKSKGMTDLETLRQSMKKLLSTIDEVRIIQATGREQQQLIEQELLRMDRDLKENIERK